MDMKTKKRSLVEQKQTRTCRGAPLELCYELVCESARGTPPMYGVRVRACENGVCSDAEVCEITSSLARIQRLLDVLSRGTVTPQTLRDVVEDWL